MNAFCGRFYFKLKRALLSNRVPGNHFHFKSVSCCDNVMHLLLSCDKQYDIKRILNIIAMRIIPKYIHHVILHKSCLKVGLLVCYIFTRLTLREGIFISQLEFSIFNSKEGGKWFELRQQKARPSFSWPQ